MCILHPHNSRHSHTMQIGGCEISSVVILSASLCHFDLVPWPSCSSFSVNLPVWRMTRLILSTVLLLVTFCALSAQDKEDDVVLVYYPHKTLNPARGSSVKLSCDAHYDFKQCGLLHVAWFQRDAELRHPKKYHTTVNETISDQRMRRRQVVTEILNLTPEDSGEFQCRAKCHLGETGMGHLIIIDVQG